MTTHFGLCDDCGTLHRHPVQYLEPGHEPTVSSAVCAERAKVLASLLAA